MRTILFTVLLLLAPVSAAAYHDGAPHDDPLAVYNAGSAAEDWFRDFMLRGEMDELRREQDRLRREQDRLRWEQERLDAENRGSLLY